MKNGRCSKN
jgi:hypothetical protein